MHYSRLFILSLLCYTHTTHTRIANLKLKQTFAAFCLGSMAAASYVNNQRVRRGQEVVTLQEMGSEIAGAFTDLKAGLETYLTSKSDNKANKTRKK